MIKNILNFNKPKVLNINSYNQVIVVSFRTGKKDKRFVYIFPTYNILSKLQKGDDKKDR